MLPVGELHADGLAEEVAHVPVPPDVRADDESGRVDGPGQVGERAVDPAGEVAEVPGNLGVAERGAGLGDEPVAQLEPAVVGEVGVDGLVGDRPVGVFLRRMARRVDIGEIEGGRTGRAGERGCREGHERGLVGDDAHDKGMTGEIGEPAGVRLRWHVSGHSHLPIRARRQASLLARGRHTVRVMRVADSVTAELAAPARPRVVVIGSGFGGLFAARAMRRMPVDVTVLAKTSHHLFQPLLYQVATGILSPGEIAPTTREVLARQRNAEVLLGEVVDIDLAARTVTASTRGEEHVHGYDHLIVAAGAAQSWFGHDEFAVHAPGMKSIDDALELRGRIYGAFELAELAAVEGRTDEVPGLMTFVVVGAGPTGVEMAGQLVELSKRTLARDFRHIDPTDARVILLDASPHVLGAFAEGLQERSRRALQRLGIDVRLDARVIDVDATGLVVQETDGRHTRIEAATKVWAAGVQASSLAAVLARQVGVDVDRSGRIPVQPDLTLPGRPEVHVVGDMASLDHLPGVAQVAIQGARHSVAQIRHSMAGEATGAPFHYHDKGSMATISRFSAIAQIGPLRLTGFVAWVMWLAVHLFYIIGFKSRVTTLLDWAVGFIGRGRSERTVTEQQIFARLALEQAGPHFVREVSSGQWEGPTESPAAPEQPASAAPEQPATAAPEPPRAAQA